MRVGEASHPGPPFTVAGWNVASLLKYADFVNEFEEADVWGLSEVRLTTDAMPIAADALPSWRPVWGKPQPMRGGPRQSRLDAKQGGVGILAGPSHITTATPRTSVGEELFQSGRWQSVTVRMHGGAGILHVVTPYGHPRANEGGDAMEENEAFITKVMEEADSLGDAPVIIIGDLNVIPERSPTIHAAHVEGRWMDVAALVGEAEGREPEDTYYRDQYSSRIDVALVNPAAAQWLRGFRMVERAVNGQRRGHQIIMVDFDTTVRPSFALQPKVVAKLPDDAAATEEERKIIADDVMEEFEANFWEACFHHDVDGMLNSFNHMGEEFLLRETAHITGDDDYLNNPRFRGRGRAAATKRVRVGAGGQGADGSIPDPEKMGIDGLSRTLRE